MTLFASPTISPAVPNAGPPALERTVAACDPLLSRGLSGDRQCAEGNLRRFMRALTTNSSHPHMMHSG
jgi:hypothetical protein